MWRDGWEDEIIGGRSSEGGRERYRYDGIFQKWGLDGNRMDAVLQAPAQDAESGRVMGKSCDKGKGRRKGKRSPRASFEAVLNGDPAGFVIGLRMMLELLQGQERRIAG